MFVSLPIHDCPSLCPSGITGMSSVASPSKDFTIPEGVHVMLIEYARSDAEFEACLADEPSLQQCLDDLNKAGHGVHREATDPKLYVERDLVVPITNKLTEEGVLLHGVRVFWQELKCRHVIASEAYYSTVQYTVANLRKKCKARVRCEVPIDLDVELLDGIFREQESEFDEVVEELSRLIASWDPLGEHCSSFCMAEIQTPEFHDGIWMDIWMEMYFL